MSEGRAGLWLSPARPSTRLRSPPTNISAHGDMTTGDKDKAERLAAALRENLRRRKAQAREAAPRESQEKKDPNQPAKE